jgi:GNAT superfamily N-acetyltransferase
VFNDVRTLMPSDVPSAMELSTAANWNQTPEDWCRILQLSAEGCRCIEDDGKIVATATLLPYGTRLAWIGMVLTRPEYRRQGLARRLMEDAIVAAERRGIHTLKLDATDEGRPLYEDLGFVVEKTVERWGRDSRELVPAKADVSRDDIARQDHFHGLHISDELFAWDTEAFGVSRKRLLEVLSDSGSHNATSDGYVLSRPGRTARYLGPCVTSSEADARLLIATHLQNPANTDGECESSKSCNWYWDLLPANPEAVRCAEKFGFTRRRVLCRMRRGEMMENNDAMVYAIAGFELG